MLPSIPSITIYYHLCIYFLEYLNVFHNRCGVSAMFLSIGHDDPECPFFLTYLTASTLLCKKKPWLKIASKCVIKHGWNPNPRSKLVFQWENHRKLGWFLDYPRQ